MANVWHSSDEVPVQGLHRPLRPFQAYAVWWMLKSEAVTTTGGFLADEMGVGKTIITQGTIVMAQ